MRGVRSNEACKGFVLPAAALVRNQANEPIVWIKSGAERFIAAAGPSPARSMRKTVSWSGAGADNRVCARALR